MDILRRRNTTCNQQLFVGVYCIPLCFSGYVMLSPLKHLKVVIPL